MNLTNYPTDELVESCIAPELLDAYKQTHYVISGDIDGAGAVKLLVGVHSDALAALYKKRGIDCCAFMTAWNPWSQSLPDGPNVSRQREFLSILKARSLRWIDGIGKHPSNDWPGEPSVLVLGLSLASAKVLAQAYEQNAFVWAGPDATPQLILMR